MDTTKIRFGEAVAGVSALLLFLVMFLPWYGFSLKGTSGLGIAATTTASHSGWHSGALVDIILLVTIVAAIGMVLLSMSQRSTALPISANVAVTLLGGLSVLLILFRIVSKPSYCRHGACAPDNLLDKSLKFWIFIALIAAAGIAVGAFLAMREEGTSFSDAAHRLRGGSGGAPPPPPPPPPSPPPEQPAAPQQPPPTAPPQAPPAGGEQPPAPSQPPPSQPPPGGGGPTAG